MVVAKDGDKLYNNTVHVIRSHLERIVAEKIAPAFPQLLSLQNHNTIASSSSISTPVTPLTGKFLASNDELELFLKIVNKIWLDHLIVSNMIKDVLMYLVCMKCSLCDLSLLYSFIRIAPFCRLETCQTCLTLVLMFSERL
jgi:hypothetical protein